MLVRVLGRVAVDRDDGTRFEPPSGPQRRLLSLLALRAGRPVTSETICDLFELSPSAVRTSVSRLRKQLGDDVLITEAGGYLLRAETDAQRLQAELGQARSLQPNDAAEVLTAALDLFTGPPIDEFGAEAWASPEAARLNEMRAAAIEELVELRIAAGRHDDAIALLHPHIAESPYRDHPHEQLMRALAITGRQVEALRVFQDYRNRLIDEVGVEPGESIRAVEQLISLGDLVETNEQPSLERRPPATTNVNLSNLPDLENEFVGRDEDLVAVASGLSEARLVTLTGPGGVGKTRLAVQAAHGQSGVFSDGVWLVELVECATTSDIVRSFASAVGVGVVDTADELAQEVAGRNMLVVFDNCEHILDLTSAVVDALLAATSRLQILATSRTPLNVIGERLVRIDPLQAPAAVELFLSRAQAAGVEIDDGDASVVADICDRLDGIPLAVELAAATARVFSPAELLQRLDQRFELLKGGQRGRVAGRHASLRAAVDSSYEALTEDGRTFFTRLAVFAGEFPFSAVEAGAIGLGSSSFDLVAELIDRSLLVTSKSAAGLTTYRMLETLRHYGTDRLRDDSQFDEAVERQIQWCEQVVAAEVAAAFGASESTSLAELVAVAPNVRLAATRLVAMGDRDRSIQLVSQLSDVSYAANALAALAEPIARPAGAVAPTDDLGELVVAGIELTRRSTAGSTTGRAELAAELGLALTSNHPGALQIPVMLIATALRVGPGEETVAATVARAADDSVDLPERARLLVAAGLASYYGSEPPADFDLVEESMAAASAAGMRRLTIATASMACIAGIRLDRPADAAALAGPVLSGLDGELVHPSIMTAGLVSMYTEIALRADLSEPAQFLGVRLAGSTLRGDFNRLGLAFARLVQHHGNTALALRAVGACERANRSDFSNQQVQTIIDNARVSLDEREVDALLAAGAVTEQSDLYREMWTALEPRIAATH